MKRLSKEERQGVSVAGELGERDTGNEMGEGGREGERQEIK